MKITYLIKAIFFISCLVGIQGCAVTYIDAGIHMGTEIAANGNVSVDKTPASSPVVNNVDHLKSHSNKTSGEPTQSNVVAPTAVVKPAIKTEVIEACDRIVPPIIGQIPRLTPKEIENIATSSAANANAQLLDQLEKIYKYASNKSLELSTSFNKQWKSCRKVTIVVP